MTATNRIIEELYDAPSYSRELSDRLGVRFKTVSQALTLLRRRGIVEPMGRIGRGPGRPMSLYAEYLSEHGPMLKTVLRDRLCIASADRFDRAIRLAQVRVAGSKDGARLMVGKM